MYKRQVCNEAVRLAKKRGFQNLSGYVNGVLRTCLLYTSVIKEIYDAGYDDDLIIQDMIP